MPDVLLEYLDDANHHAAQIDSLEGDGQLCGLRDDHTVTDKTGFRLFVTNYDLADDTFFQVQAVFAAYVLAQVDVQGAFAADIGIKAELIALGIDGFGLIAVDPSESLHILCRVEQFREGDFDVAFRL